ncbi:EAL domain-containing protein [Magnetospirillum sp. UT-4]|uniref:EAL domain-containing protein n=1 Tax=Magnetospirillum sp. UT-4 TaxID=2681467 RepID=UPI0013820669|nr:EAL domain-containing protein [Magnetospirillum sp. UT-4]CAA7623583.1 conserved hypothetical protein [Magnetospirillum sp. UT-4]
MPAGDLDRSRDLYVAFAFAAADLLVEVDAEGKVCFAVGAAMALTGRSARAITGMPLSDLFVAADADRVQRLLARIDAGERLRYILLHGQGREGGAPVPVAMAGYRHPDRPNGRLVALAHAHSLEPSEEARSPVSQLLARDEFATLAKRMMTEGGGNGDPENAYRLTMIDLPQVDTVRAAAGAVAADEFVAELGERLKSVSVGGDAAGELGENRFGIIHTPSVNPEVINATVTELVANFLPDAEIGPIQATSIALDADGISQEEATNALLYTLNRFASGEVSLDNLASEMKPRLSATVEQMRQVKAVIEKGEFELVFQPIVDMWTDVVHHFECLVRFPGQDSPFETVTFAENVGIVGSLDLAILNRVVAFMRSNQGNHEALRFAVNLSGRSLSHPQTSRQLIDIVQTLTDLKGRLLFELTESAEVSDLTTVNAILQELRRRGFEVCLDDFGAGSAAFHYLRALQVDHVKIDGAYVKDVTGSGASMPFLRAIAGMCNELKIDTIAEYVETAEAQALLKLLKVRFGQGYHFGKPMQPKPVEGSPLKGWIQGGITWHKGLLIFKAG